jgi:transposase-like protein
VQTCVVHLVRNTLRYASRQHWQKITTDLRKVYTAPTLDAATERFEEFEAIWGVRYPAVIRLWRDAWEEFIPFLQFPAEVRSMIYTTNSIESLNARFRRATRVRGHFPNEAAALKVLYLTIRTRDARWQRRGPGAKLEAGAQHPHPSLRRQNQYLKLTIMPLTQKIGQTQRPSLFSAILYDLTDGGDDDGGE